MVRVAHKRMGETKAAAARLLHDSDGPSDATEKHSSAS
jgi:hypothetical protein